MARPRSAYALSISSFFIAYLINQLINRIVSWVQIHLFFMLICLEDVYYFWMQRWMKNVNNFQIAKVQPQGVA